MKGRHFHHQPRSRFTAIGPIAHAGEDDQIETWMIGQGIRTQMATGTQLFAGLYERMPCLSVG